MKQSIIRHYIDTLAALLLFGVFAVCILAVLLSGADAYRRLTLRDRAAADWRTCVQYLAARVRQSDYAGSIAVDDFASGSLVLDAGSDHPTWIYCREGWLTELYCSVENRPDPGAGQPLMKIERLSFDLEGDLLTIKVSMEDGEAVTLLLSLRSGEEELL